MTNSYYSQSLKIQVHILGWICLFKVKAIILNNCRECWSACSASNPFFSLLYVSVYFCIDRKHSCVNQVQTVAPTPRRPHVEANFNLRPTDTEIPKRSTWQIIRVYGRKNCDLNRNPDNRNNDKCCHMGSYCLQMICLSFCFCSIFKACLTTTTYINDKVMKIFTKLSPSSLHVMFMSCMFSQTHAVSVGMKHLIISLSQRQKWTIY